MWTCEVAPHHLLFNHTHIGSYDTNYKMNPPLRTAEDNAALLEGLIGGVFDVITSDHAPHTEFEKNNDFASAPFGITGLETALPSLFDAFIAKGVFGWNLIVKHYSANPRRLLKLDPVPIKEGGVAEFIIFNPERASTFTREFMKSKSINTPFLNKTLQGLVERVIYKGEETAREVVHRRVIKGGPHHAFRRLVGLAEPLRGNGQRAARTPKFILKAKPFMTSALQSFRALCPTASLLGLTFTIAIAHADMVDTGADLNALPTVPNGYHVLRLRQGASRAAAVLDGV